MEESPYPRVLTGGRIYLNIVNQVENLLKDARTYLLHKKKENPISKNILVTGKAGIGKSLFCQKLVRDWADNVLFQEESDNEVYGFDFVYLLTFRHLNDLHKKELTLQELLNRCSLLDEHSSIDDSLMEYMVKNQDRIVFIFDAYDEYAQRESITSDCIEQKYENNPHKSMPVSALVSKLLKRKFFGNAVVMVTSRQDESNELGGMNFGTLVEIVGFSKEHVKEYICKYFKSNDEVRHDVLSTVLTNKDLLSLAHVPMFCFLICWCMEWHLKFQKEQDLPITMTELYSEFTDIFEAKHHSKSKYRSEQIPEQFQQPDVVKTTLEKLKKLAVETMKIRQFIFEEHDLSQFGLNTEDIADLKASGLLTSSTGYRTSATKITHYYCFSHLTLHEYLTAVWYVENNQVHLPYRKDYEMVYRFFVGVCRKNKREDLMEAFFKGVEKDLPKNYFWIIYEFGDKEFGAKMMHCYPQCFSSRSKSGELVISSHDLLHIQLDWLNYSCKKYEGEHAMSSVGSRISKIMMTLRLSNRLAILVDPLRNPFCPIVSLRIFAAVIFPGNSESFFKLLHLTKITNVEIVGLTPHIIPNLQYLKKVLSDPRCKINTLTIVIRHEMTNDQASKMEELSLDLRNINPNSIINVKNI